MTLQERTEAGLFRSGYVLRAGRYLGKWYEARITDRVMPGKTGFVTERRAYGPTFPEYKDGGALPPSAWSW